VAPVARGSDSAAATACAVSAAASTPALPTSVAAVPSGCLSSATSRWIGSVVVLPAVVADSCAVSMASRARVVNLSAPNWLMSLPRAGPMLTLTSMLPGLPTRHPFQRSQS
jgi:hypothetical protein